MKGTKIEFLRNIRGYTQEYMAKKCDIELTRYKRIEAKGVQQIKDEELRSIAAELGTNLEDLKNPNPYLVIHIDNNQFSLGYSEQNNTMCNELLEIVQQKDTQINKRDEQIDRLIGLLEIKAK
jgi:transcriptional regulator with XRE-family HTH domain